MHTSVGCGWQYLALRRRIFPVSLAWHCVVLALASFDAAGNFLPRRRLALAQEAARWHPLRQFVVWHLCSSLPSSCCVPSSRRSSCVFMTSQCGAQRSSGVLQDFSLVCPPRTDKRWFLDLKIVGTSNPCFVELTAISAFFHWVSDFATSRCLHAVLKPFHVRCLTVYSGYAWPHSNNTTSWLVCGPCL